MRVTLTLDDDLHAYLKHQSKSTGRTMGAIMSELLRLGFLQGDFGYELDDEGKLRLNERASNSGSLDSQSGSAA